MDLNILNGNLGTPSMEPIRFSNGVEFTVEELSGLTITNPALVEKIQKLKHGDAEKDRYIQQLATQVKELQTKPVAAPAAPASTPAATAGEPVDHVRQWQLQQMTSDRFTKAVQAAVAAYGAEVVEMITTKFGDIFRRLVSEGKYDAQFDLLFSQGFAELMKDANAVTAYSNYKLGKTQEQIAEEARLKAQADILRATPATTTGIPVGGVAPVTAPATEPTQPRSLKEASALARKRFQELREGK